MWQSIFPRTQTEYGMFTMGDVARCSIGKPGEYYSEDLLYKLFGINAELLIDHAWGWEPCTMADIKAYKPSNSSIGSGQVLHCPYSAEKARLVVREMTEQLALDLVDKGLVTDQVILTVGYDIGNLSNPMAQEQRDLFTDYASLEREREEEEAELGRERKLQKAMLDIKKRYGKNALLKGVSLVEGATAMDRNNQIGGHRA